jgi:hypothetical protein
MLGSPHQPFQNAFTGKHFSTFCIPPNLYSHTLKVLPVETHSEKSGSAFEVLMRRPLYSTDTSFPSSVFDRLINESSSWCHAIIILSDSCESDKHTIMLSSSCDFDDTSQCYHNEMSTKARTFNKHVAVTRLARTLFNTAGAMVFLQTHRHAIIILWVERTDRHAIIIMWLEVVSWTYTSSCHHPEM